MIHTLTSSMTLDLPLPEVFAFFADAANLERITPPELRFRILTPMPVEMREGLLLDYRLRLFGFPLTWRSEITRWDPPHLFVDEQVRGPYRSWAHTHRFTQERGSTRIEDHVEYGLPLHPFGEIAYPPVALHLGRIFRYRRGKIEEALGGGAAEGAGP